MTSRAATEQSLRGLALADAASEPRCEECGATVAPGALATALATREHEAAPFALGALWCRSHAPERVPEPTPAREQVLFQADVGATVDTANQQHTPVAVTPVMVAHSPIERVVADGGEIIIADDEHGEIIHDETGRYGDEGDGPRDHDLAEWSG